MRALLVFCSEDKHFYVGIAQLSACLKEAGHEVTVINFRPEDSYEEFEKDLLRLNPQLVGFHVLSYQWKTVKDLATIARNTLKVPVVCGGVHPTFAPEEVMASGAVDILCRGEGEGALLDLVQALERGDGYEHISNLWVRSKNGTMNRNDLRPLIPDLDSLPFWDREVFGIGNLLQKKAAAGLLAKEGVMPVAAGRGCPFRCTYCSNAPLQEIYRGKGKFARRRSVSNLLSELKMLKEQHPVRYFEFWDEDFTAAGRDWLDEFCKEYKEEIGIPFSIGLRVETSPLECVEKLRDAGLFLFFIGVECGNEEYRRKHLNRNMKNEDLIRIFDASREMGIIRAAFNMLALPFETPDLVRETIELNRRLDPDYFFFYIFQAFPGTALYDLCKREGFFSPVNTYTYQSPEGAIVQPSMPPEEVKRCWEACEDLAREIERKRERG